MDRVDRIEELSEAECLRLLSTVPIGRVVYTEHALLRVVPVPFRVEADRRLLLVLPPDPVAARTLHGAVAAFQADRLDAPRRAGWSVVLHGRAEVVREPVAPAELPRPWLEGAEPLVVRLTAELVTGRRLSRKGTAAPAPHAVTGAPREPDPGAW
ncbi:pyridoxamine 5'-phosphate oxidase family protein [Kitasatospora viridis]|uniref:Pyridoxamine 5'-phosphate oxidase-like protein n=1 Tax=Kitasatospora viridis TaxID=281105 RepID=A0A561UAU3_9ACTN|nr:pyridoxamine 5'-phosphate oxidase family protein [Kitasatospora viridis]TWF96470.1 pyridoxamine 5'-phosphate oxidase-like protein [Kitasatospora viridis]